MCGPWLCDEDMCSCVLPAKYLVSCSPVGCEYMYLYIVGNKFTTIGYMLCNPNTPSDYVTLACMHMHASQSFFVYRLLALPPIYMYLHWFFSCCSAVVRLLFNIQ